MKIEIGKKHHEQWLPYQTVERVKCVDCSDKGEMCENCDWKTLYDVEDEEYKKEYYKACKEVSRVRREKVFKAIARNTQKKQRRRW